MFSLDTTQKIKDQDVDKLINLSFNQLIIIPFVTSNVFGYE